MNPIRQDHPVIKKPTLEYVMALGIGIVVGFFGIFLTGIDLRWTIYLLGAFSLFVFFLLVPDKRVFLLIFFVLSLQVNVHLRFLFGYAGTGGLAFPLIVFIGLGVVLWYGSTGQLRKFQWAGSMKYAIAALFLTSLLSLLTTSERFAGITILLQELEFYFLYWLVFNVVRTEKDFLRIINFLFLTLCVQAIIYFVQSKLGINFNLTGDMRVLGGVPRPGGTVSTNPAGFASFIMPALMMAIACFASRKSFMSRNYTFLVAGLGTLAIVMTYTRAAWIGYLLACMFIFFYGYYLRIIRHSMLLAILAGIAALMAVFLPVLLQRFETEYGGVGGTDAVSATVDERMGLIRIALVMISEHPFSGVGIGAYAHVFKEYIPAGMDQWFNVVHNEFLRRTAESGIPGGIAFVALLIMGFRVAFRLTRSSSPLIRSTALGWIAALIAIIWQMNWVPWEDWSYNAMLWLMLGIMDGAQRFARTDPEHEYRGSNSTA